MKDAARQRTITGLHALVSGGRNGRSRWRCAAGGQCDRHDCAQQDARPRLVYRAAASWSPQWAGRNLVTAEMVSRSGGIDVGTNRTLKEAYGDVILKTSNASPGDFARGRRGAMTIASFDQHGTAEDARTSALSERLWKRPLRRSTRRQPQSDSIFARLHRPAALRPNRPTNVTPALDQLLTEARDVVAHHRQRADARGTR